MSVTLSLAKLINKTNAEDLPAWTIHEAKRTLINMLGISLSASASAGNQMLLSWVKNENAAPRASIIGSSVKTSPFNAAMMNGFLAHLQDYDDTHFPTVLHPTSPVWPAVFAASEDTNASGLQALGSFVLGAEIACRLAMSVHPWHYDMGWHITGTTGVFGAAVATGKILNLDVPTLNMAIGQAGTYACGIREVFGSHSKPMHAAKAASNGLQSAYLAVSGFTGADDIIGGRRGFWEVLSPNGHNPDILLNNFCEHWELKNNGLKPYANGVVSHPIQDAVIFLRNNYSIDPLKVTSITAHVHPLVLELMNRPDPKRGLEGKFSFQHCAAAALVDGAGHDAQFSDEKIVDPLISSVRSKVSAIIDNSLEEDQVHLSISIDDGVTLEHSIDHATGSPQNPMPDSVLERKFIDLAGEVMPAHNVSELLHVLWELDKAPNLNKISQLISIK
tara:strand:- start:7451 stop:8791 length:1341 start_codon:yes stop_codon:yes gene_type:complete